jgi:acetyl-CoA synthetase (ADP-forming)
LRAGEVDSIFRTAIDDGRGFLYEHEAKRLCELYNMPVAVTRFTASLEEAVSAAEGTGYPIVMKVVSPDILHKSDAGGVLIGIKDELSLREGYNKIMGNVRGHQPEAEIIGVLVQEMAPSSTEVIVGSTMDPTFGPVIMFGLGGIFVEILEDVSFRIIPLERLDAMEMIKEIKAYKILEGARGHPKVDLDAIVEILISTSNMVMDCPEIKELDMNPILLYEDRAVIVDARVIL